MFLYAKVGRFFIGLCSAQVFLTATAVYNIIENSICTDEEITLHIAKKNQ